MNSLLERVNLVCQNVRESNSNGVTFKKLLSFTKKEFRLHDIDLILKSKKDKTLETDHFYVMAYYDPADDFESEPPIEVIIYHNFDTVSQFQQNQITEFLVQIYDAVVHELRHQIQSRKRHFKIYSDHPQEPYINYLADPDEVDAYALSIAIELLRAMPTNRAKRYMSKMTILSKMKMKGIYVSPNLQAYVSHFQNSFLLRKMSKKVYKHLETIDRNNIFM